MCLSVPTNVPTIRATDASRGFHKTKIDSSILAAKMEGDADSFPLTTLQSSSSHQSLEDSSIQAPFLEKIEQVVIPAATEPSDIDIDKLLEDCRDSLGNFSEFIKNEPIEVGTNDAGSYPSTSFLFSSKHFTKQQELLETTEQLVKPEAAEASDVDPLQIIEQSLEDRKDSHGNLNEFIKKEPSEDDESSIECDNGEPTFSAISVKDEELSVEVEEQQTKETKVKAPHFTPDKNKRYGCPYCPLRFKFRARMHRHKAIHEGVSKLPCDICGKSVDKFHLKDHKLIHSGERPHKCEICEMSFATIAGLRAHIRRHAREKYKCKYCERLFSDSNQRKKHMRVHIGKNVHICKLCPSAFPVASELRDHFATHVNEDAETRKRNMKALRKAKAALDKKAKESVEQHRKNYDPDKPYACPYCPLRFKTRTTRHKHKETHTGVKRVTCDICGKSIIKRHLKEHKLIHSDEKPHKCDHCEMRFVSITHLRTHTLTHTGEKPYKCKYCERSFTQNTPYRQHMRIHLGDNIHRCELCPLAFPLVAKLRLHLTTHTNEDPETRERNMKALKEADAELEKKAKEYIEAHRITYTYNKDKPTECPHCFRTFRTKSQMIMHKAIHEEGNREDCDICGKSIVKRCLKVHKLTHSGEKPHKCDHCEKRFVTFSDLRVHIRSHTGETPYKCKYCECSFAKSCYRRLHMRVHLGDNIHRCELCPLAFPAVIKLREHLTTHENEDPETREQNMKALKEAEAELQLKISQQQNERKAKEKAKAHCIIPGEGYECPYCPKKFSSYTHMSEHKKIHEGANKEACDICGKNISKKHLKEHKLIHSDDKPYKCHICERRFARKDYLRGHLRQHIGGKPYKCEHCELSFSRSYLRLQHMSVHIGNDNVHRCELCPLAFPAASELRAHFTTHKNEDPETREQNMKALKEAEAKLQLKLCKKEKNKLESRRTRSGSYNLRQRVPSKNLKDDSDTYNFKHRP